jgi:anion-transporting  ArsA/GET3 family ATPase
MDSLADLGLGDLLRTAPPGLDEAIAISKVVEFVESADYARFTRIIFDTAPTGHTLRMLALPSFVSAMLQKVSRLQDKLSGAAGTIGEVLFGSGGGKSAIEQLKVLQERVDGVAKLFRLVPLSSYFVFQLRSCPNKMHVVEITYCMWRLCYFVKHLDQYVAWHICRCLLSLYCFAEYV